MAASHRHPVDRCGLPFLGGVRVPSAGATDGPSTSSDRMDDVGCVGRFCRRLRSSPVVGTCPRSLVRQASLGLGDGGVAHAASAAPTSVGHTACDSSPLERAKLAWTGGYLRHWCHGLADRCRGAGHARCRASRAGRCHHVVRNGIVVGDGDGHDRRLRRHGARYHDRAHDRRSIDDRRNCVAGHRDCHTRFLVGRSRGGTGRGIPGRDA